MNKLSLYVLKKEAKCDIFWKTIFYEINKINSILFSNFLKCQLALFADMNSIKRQDKMEKEFSLELLSY